MRNRLIDGYVATMVVLALVALALTDWATLATLHGGSLAAFIALVAMGLLSEGLAVKLSVGKNAGSTSVVFIPLLASLQLFGPAAAAAMALVSTTVSEFLIRKKGLTRVLFNVSQLVVATYIGGLAFGSLGGSALQPFLDQNLQIQFGPQFGPFLAFGLVLMLLNHAFVSLAIALSQELKFRQVWQQVLYRSGAGGLQDLMISPIAIGVAFFYVQLDVWGILVAFLPVLFVRHAYLDTSRLREANDALLKALVKAIETRDPYTSGHSLRVAYLAQRIAEAMGMDRKTAERIERAALLHDIGKIEAVYTGILSKPSFLSAEERAVIESHVTRGEELLRNLSSFSEDILQTVRHHHERYDGGGYPDGLRGQAIPIGARIVAVCDAVDAMLSDRPYRKALSLEIVRAQLAEHRGSQFSPEVLDAILKTDLLGEYAAMMGQARTGPLPVETGYQIHPQEMPQGEPVRVRSMIRKTVG